MKVIGRPVISSCSFRNVTAEPEKLMQPTTIVNKAAILVTGTTDNGVAIAVGLNAIVLASVNMVGGFVVTDRMLQMFVRKKKKPAADGAEAAK